MTGRAAWANTRRHELSLTGPRSHVLVEEPGVGSLWIGPERQADLRVAPGDRIDWSVFDEFTTPAGSPWPRWFRYTGDDTGFLDWSRNRPIEGFTWRPSVSHDADAARARIDALHVELPDAPIHLVPPTDSSSGLTLSGHLGRVTLAGAPPRRLGLDASTITGFGGAPVQLPDIPGSAAVNNLSLMNGALHQPISLVALRAFPALTSIALHGPFADLEGLADFPRLTSIELRHLPRLDGMPQLDSFPELDRFIAWNVAEQGGKELRTQLRTLSKSRALGYGSVSKLRSAQWFATEQTLPYGGWRRATAKVARMAHRAAQQRLAECIDAAAAERALADFVRTFNNRNDIETTEREDIAAAVAQLAAPAQVAALVSQERAQQIFEEERDY